MSSRSRNQSRLGAYRGANYDASKGLDNACRTTAFAVIYDKAVATQAKTKTAMCRSILAGKPCRFGDRCSYAHSKDELKVQKCAFGVRCRTRHSKTNPCRFDHTEEVQPAPAPRPTLAQEVKAAWEEEDARIEAAVARWKASRPKLSPFPARAGPLGQPSGHACSSGKSVGR